MKLIELLTTERVVVPLAADTLSDAAARLVETVIASGSVADPEKLRELVGTETPGQVVTVGEAFLLHLRTDAVLHLVGALGVTPEPVSRDDDSSKTARIIILIVAPPKETSTYLQTLSAFARVLGRLDVVEAIVGADGPNEVLEAAPLAEIELPGYLTVRDVMVPRLLSVRPDTTLGEASKVMVVHNVSALPVVSDTNELLGIVSHREVLRFLLPMYLKRISSGAFSGASAEMPSSGGDPHELPVREVMDRSVLSVSEEQTLAEVATLMVNKNLDRFPVVREGALVGVLTREDVVRRIFGR